MAVLCLSVPGLTRSRERNGVASDRKEGRTRELVYRSKVKVTKSTDVVTENQPHLGTGRPTNFKRVTRVENYDRITSCTVTSKLKALIGCSRHHLQGAGYIVSAALTACSRNYESLYQDLSTHDCVLATTPSQDNVR